MAYEARFNKSGNTKVGHMWTWNTLAGNSIIEGCKGTCGKYCTGCWNSADPKKSHCYVIKSYNMYKSVIKSHIRNTMAIRNDIDKAFSEMATQIKRAKNKPAVIRIHSSGEIESAAELKHWIALAVAFPETQIYTYTKAFDIVDEVFSGMDEKDFPENFWINLSVWHENGIQEFKKWQHLRCVRAYVYDDGFDYEAAGLKFDCHCPAYRKVEKVSKKGVVSYKVKLFHDLTCDKCKICFQEKAKVCACLDH